MQAVEGAVLVIGSRLHVSAWFSAVMVAVYTQCRGFRLHWAAADA